VRIDCREGGGEVDAALLVNVSRQSAEHRISRPGGTTAEFRVVTCRYYG
jgi:hypothetical protein